MTRIHVDLDALRALHQRCAVLRQALGDRDHTIRHSIDMIGRARVTDALHEFESHWNDGQEKVRHHLDAILERLAAAILQYEHTEHGLRAQLEEAR